MYVKHDIYLAPRRTVPSFVCFTSSPHLCSLVHLCLSSHVCSCLHCVVALVLWMLSTHSSLLLHELFLRGSLNDILL